MKQFLATLLLIFFNTYSYSQCTLQNSTSCECADQSQSDCDLLPDITVSWQWTSQDYIEYAPGSGLQSGELNYIDNYFEITPEIEAMGRLRVGARTPNIGVGPLNLRGVDENGYRTMICNDLGVSDTFQIYDPNWSQSTFCPDGSNPKQIVWQRVYHKNSDGSMSYYEVEVGTMQYHPSHGHMHFDQWTIMTLRSPDPNNMSNPLEWPIIGEGAKVGFCVMDLGNCSGINAGCRDDETIYGQGNLLSQQDFPNYGLGGGSFGCSPLSQGISVGYNDTYGSYLDGMFMNIPLGTCNGDYAIVLEVPQNMIESNLENNYTWVPVTLTQQTECEFIYGCTDSNALNYDSLANVDNGSCIYLQCDFDIGDFFSVPVNCSLDNDGQIFSIIPMQGGTPPYSVELFKDDISIFQQVTTGDSLIFQFLSSGNYTILVEDSLGCLSTFNTLVGLLNNCTPEILTNDTSVCIGDNILIESSGANITPSSIYSDDVHSDIIDIGFDSWKSNQ